MNYREQLNSKEWKSKREEIISRDHSKCTVCGVERNKILRLDNGFGIKSYDEFKADGYTFLKSSIEHKAIVLKLGKKTELCYYLGNSKHMPDVKGLNYAKQWNEFLNSTKKSRPRLVCFDKDIDFEDMYDLNVHHKYYIFDKLAWEYDNKALITLCASCHEEEHLKNEIPVYDNDFQLLYYAETCPKCLGSGVLPHFDYFCNGICFNCMGTGNINFQIL